MTSSTRPPGKGNRGARARDLAELRAAAAALRRGLVELEDAIERLEAGGLGAAASPLPSRRPNWRHRDTRMDERLPHRVQLRLRGKFFGMTLYEGSDAYVAFNILREAKRPLHVDDLLAEMVKMGHEASRASLIVTLARLAAREMVFARVPDTPNTFTLMKGINVGKPYASKAALLCAQHASDPRTTLPREGAAEGADVASERALVRSEK